MLFTACCLAWLFKQPEVNRTGQCIHTGVVAFSTEVKRGQKQAIFVSGVLPKTKLLATGCLPVSLCVRLGHHNRARSKHGARWIDCAIKREPFDIYSSICCGL